MEATPTLKELFDELRLKDAVVVHVTEHAASRLRERRAKDYRKLDEKLLKDVVMNVVRDGVCLIGERDVKIATRKYTLACTIEGGELVVKTVMRTRKELWEKLAKKTVAKRWRTIDVKLGRRGGEVKVREAAQP